MRVRDHRATRDRLAGEHWCVGRLLNRSGLRSIDPHLRGRRRRLGQTAGEALRVRRVGRGEHGRPRGDALRGQAMMHIDRSQQAEARMMVLGVDQGKKARQCARPSWIEPNRSGNAGRYFSVLNWASEKGLLLET
jgi:hypothetical protein